MSLTFLPAEPPDKKYICSICECIMLDAVQLCCCGVRMCEVCAQDLPSCIQCNKTLGGQERGDPSHYFHDVFIRNKINKAYVGCETLTCQWTGKLLDYQDHLNTLHGTQVAPEISDLRSDEASRHQSEGRQDANTTHALNVQDSETEVIRMLSPDDEIKLPDDKLGQNIPRAKDATCCAGCGCYVPFDRLHDHRSNCYKIHLYNGNCYSTPDYPVGESGLQFGTDEVLLGSGGLINSGLQPVVMNVVGTITNGVFQLQKSYADLEQRIEKYRRQIQSFFTRRFCPIEYPIIGTMCWKVSDLSHRLHDAENSTILSSFFYSSTDGYRMRLQLDLKSGPTLLLLIVQGNNDHSLVWPFHNKIVNFGLLSFGKSGGIYESLPVHPTPQCYSEDMGNVAVRLSLHLNLLERSNEFIIDDCIFIRCKVNE